MSWPHAARAQQPTKVYRIAFVHPGIPVSEMSEHGDSPYVTAFFKELRHLGYFEGQNLVVARYSAEGREEQYRELCSKVVEAKPDVIIAVASRLVVIMKETTKTIPIVAGMSDPVPFGIVSSISRPEGNVTGVSVEAGLEIWGKRLQVLREIVPTASKVGFLGSRKIWNGPQVMMLQKAAQELHIAVHGPPLETPIQAEEYRRVFAAIALQHVDGLIIGDQAENITYGPLIIELANSARLPTVFPYPEDIAFGALMSYGPSVVDVYRRIASYVDQILKGARPGELPIYLASQFQLVINLPAARALGVTIPPSLLVRADQVIE